MLDLILLAVLTVFSAHPTYSISGQVQDIT